MRFLRLLLIPLLFIFHIGKAQEMTPKPKQPRILLLLDGSSSMLQPWDNGKERFNAAGTIIAKLIDSIYSVNNQVEFALRVYGHQHAAQENNCLDSRKEVKFSKNNLTQMELRLASLHPYGVSPIAYSIKMAAEEDMVDPENNSYSLILITDGGESCGGDICAIAKELLEKKIAFKPYILSLVDYAPLKLQYDCLGEYMVVAKPSDIPSTVGKIVESYRNMLTLARIDKKLLQTAVANAPSALKVSTPAFKVSAEPPVKEEPKLPEVTKMTSIDVPKKTPASLPVASTEPIKPAVVTPPPAPLKKTEIAALQINNKPRLLPQMYITPSFKAIQVPAYTVTVLPSEPSTSPIIARTPAATKPDGPSKLVVPNKTIAAAQPDKTPAPPKPSTNDPKKPKEAKYTVDREEAKETTVEVYFTDGRGKFYSTTPQVVLLDPKTGQQKQKFWRTVDAGGRPDPQKEIPAGIYNLTIANKSNIIVKNVEIKENAKNKIMVQVGKASLIFTYENNPSRPVSEYTAVVNRRFEPGPIIKQKCTVELEYEPGNYYIEVNTLPVFKRNLDLDFDYIYDLKIPEDGLVNITNTESVGKVFLYMPLGDKFLQFHTIEVPGSAEGQKLKLQPGVYEAHFIKNPKLPIKEESVIRFFVKSNMVTDLELK